MKLRLLDLFCGGGGAAKGYADAGFEVVGVDLYPQKRYPYEFHQADALKFPLDGFDAVHASPPCQAYSKTKKINDRVHPKLIEKIRRRLKESGLPYIIENVVGAPLLDPITLCGTQFGLNIYRHRIFETSFKIKEPKHQEHIKKTIKMGRTSNDPKAFYHVAGHFPQVKKVAKIMGLPWMKRDELAQAIPPAFTYYIGKKLYRSLRRYQ